MVDGTKEIYRMPDGTQTGTQFTIRAKGFKSLNSTAQGNFIFLELLFKLLENLLRSKENLWLNLLKL